MAEIMALGAGMSDEASLSEESDPESEAMAEEALSDGETEPVPPRKRPRGDDKYALPTSEEMRQLRSAEDVLGQSLVGLQAEELLAEVRPRYGAKGMRKLEGVLRRLKNVLEGLRPADGVREASAELCRPLDWQRPVALDFRAPSRVDVVGGFLVRTLARPGQTVDLAVEMPATCFLPKDVLNHRYFDKRRLYVAQLAEQLRPYVVGIAAPAEGTKGRRGKKKTKGGKALRPGLGGTGPVASRPDAFLAGVGVCMLQGDANKPVVVVRPAGSKFLSQWAIRLIPQLPEEGVFDKLKLVPTRNNVRPRNAANADASENPPAPPPTPHYNNAILADMGETRRVLARLHQACQTCPALADGLVLMQVWLGQRGMRSGADTAHGGILAYIMLYLLETRRLSRRMDAMQIFSATLAFLAEHPLHRKAFKLAPDEDGVALTEAGLRAFAAAFDCVLMDGSGRLNVAASVSASAAQELQQEAAHSLNVLQGSRRDSFLTAKSEAEGTGDAAADPNRSDTIALDKEEGDAAASALSSFGDDVFRALFLERRGFWSKWDYFVGVPVLPRHKGKPAAAGAIATPRERLLQHDSDLFLDMDPRHRLARRIGSLLVRALGNRLAGGDGRSCALRPQVVHDGDLGGPEDGSYLARGHTFSIIAGEAPSSCDPRVATAAAETMDADADADADAASPMLWFGLRLDPEHAARQVDRCPDAGDAAAAQRFRAFWGDKAQLRRFKDGSLVEAVVWGDGPSSTVLREIVGQVMRTHEPRRYREGRWPCLRGAELDGLLRDEHVGSELLPHHCFHSAFRAYEALRDALRHFSLSPFPLRITSVAPVGDALRYTSLLQPLPHPLLPGFDAGAGVAAGAASEARLTMEEATGAPPLVGWLIATLERTARWPDEHVALLAVKSALCSRLAEALAEGGEAAEDVRVLAVSRFGWMEVGARGFAFRVLLVAAADTHILPDGHVAPAANAQAKQGDRASLDFARLARDTAGAAEAPAAASLRRWGTPSLLMTRSDWQLQSERRPVLHALIQGFATKVVTYGPVSRLVKRWLAGHLLASHFSAEVVDLLVAAAFQRAGRGADRGASTFPSSLFAGFLAFLRLLGTFDFRAEPLLVDLNGQGTAALRQEATQAFEAMRATAPRGGAAVGVYIPADRSHGWDSVWTRDGPERPLLSRAAATARASMNQLLGYLQRGAERDALPVDAFLTNARALSTGGLRIALEPDFRADYVPASGMLPSAAAAAVEALRGAPRLRRKVFRNLAGADAAKLLLGADPVTAFVADLRERYGHVALVLDGGGVECGALGVPGDIVFVFRPAAFLPRAFNVAKCALAAPLGPSAGSAAQGSNVDAEAGHEVLPNVAQIMREIDTLGRGLVTRIELL